MILKRNIPSKSRSCYKFFFIFTGPSFSYPSLLSTCPERRRSTARFPKINSSTTSSLTNASSFTMNWRFSRNGFSSLISVFFSLFFENLWKAAWPGRSSKRRIDASKEAASLFIKRASNGRLELPERVSNLPSFVEPFNRFRLDDNELEQ